MVLYKDKSLHDAVYILEKLIFFNYKFVELFGEVAEIFELKFFVSFFGYQFAVTHKSIVMELVKKVSHRGSTSPDSIAIRSDQKSHTYRQLFEAAKNISNTLSTADLKTVSSNLFSASHTRSAGYGFC